MDDPIAEVAARLQERAHAVPPHYLAFLETYRRTTLAVGTAVDDAMFEDPAWVQTWDVAFAELYLDALDAELEGRTPDVPRPWRLAFDAPADLPPGLRKSRWSPINLPNEPSAEERAAQRRAARRVLRLYCLACGRSSEVSIAPVRPGRCLHCGGTMLVELAAD